MNTTHFCNRTEDYHRREMRTLGWEQTVSNALETVDGAGRGILAGEGTFGERLFVFLGKRFPAAAAARNVLEVGGGYGFLMRDALTMHPGIRATVLDISPFLLERQRETLKGRPVDFLCGDFLDVDVAWLGTFDLVLLNENLGDFPTVCNVSRGRIVSPPREDPLLQSVHDLIGRYGLNIESEPFHFNIGAIQAVEKLCRAGVPFIYLCEHSCEASAPPELAPFLSVVGPGNPERIRLLGHDEYTVKFSHLAAVAIHYGYEVLRGPLADILAVRTDRDLRVILTAGSIEPEHETIRHFVYDLYKYEYLVLLKRGESASGVTRLNAPARPRF